MKQFKIAALFMCVISPLLAGAAAEEYVLSLHQCIEYAGTHSGALKIRVFEQGIAREKVAESVGAALPQINASGTVDDNEIVATQLLPGEILGQPGTFVPVKFGTKYSFNAGVQLTQMVINPAFWTSLKTTKMGVRLAQQNTQKTAEQLAYSISKLYYQTLILQKQVNILKANLEANEKMLTSVELHYQNGMAKKSDVDKIRLARNNTKSRLQQMELSVEQSLNSMKYLLGMPIDHPLKISDSALILEREVPAAIDLSGRAHEKRIDYQILQTELRVQKSGRRSIVAAFLPSLSMYARYNYQAQRQTFNVFQADQDWFKSAVIGFSLSLPLFDGLQKKSRIDQANLNVSIAEENVKQMEQAIALDVSNAEIQYRNAMENIRNEKDNWKLAEDVYADTRLQYQQGTGSPLDLIQAETSLKEAQNNYISKLFTLYGARIDLEYSKGTLKNFIQEIGD
jgi:outer membrane protein TolC